MSAVADRAEKGQAHEYLEKFQKSPEAWTMTLDMLQTNDADAAAKLFAATTLKGKIVYDLHQIPRESLPGLRDSLLANLVVFRAGPKPIRMQLVVCLANLAIQMTEWKDVLPLVVSSLGTDPQTLPCVLDFLRVLPEEVTEGRKINLTEDELSSRTTELLVDNAQQALSLLIQYSQSSVSAAQNPQLMECITSWIKELPLNDIINSPLLKVIFDDLLVEEPFDAAVECLCTMFQETRDVDECLNMIQALFPHVVALRPLLIQAAKDEDAERFKGLAKIFAEAGTCWVVLIARQPEQLRPLVEGVLETAALDKERDAISHTFTFWYELKQYLTLENFMQARLEYVDIYSKLVDIMIGHLEYPKPEDGDEKDLFDGDRELEEKFREFRHQMGDVLKDCCEVIGVTDCLGKSYTLIESWVQTYGPQATATHVPEWQKLEAPLFSLRAMGRMVPAEESIMLPRLIPLIVQIPEHEKVRFQAVMALGRYTEWTAYHSDDMLQPQLKYIMDSFGHPSKEVVRAAALSFKFFCNDCAKQLVDYLGPLQEFYRTQLDNLPSNSQEEITDGIASVLGRLPAEQVYEQLQAYCNPIISTLISMAQQASNQKERTLLADKIGLVTLFVQWVQPHVQPPQENPGVKYCQEIFPVLSAIADNYRTSPAVLEAICRCWRYMVLSYRTAMAPLLGDLATALANGFSASKQGSFLWATDSIVREFSEGTEHVDTTTTTAIFAFYEQQATTFLRAMSDVAPEELPDLIDDFFRLTVDMLLYFSAKTLTSPLMDSILAAACSSLTLLSEQPIFATLHFLRDFLAYGGDFAPSSSFDSANQRQTVPPALQDAVKRLVAAHGEHLVQRIMTGMMYTFPRDCFPDASGVLLDLFHIAPEQVAVWVQTTVSMLPAGSITQVESERLLGAIRQRVQNNEVRKVRSLLQDFTNSYRRRNVAPREGLGRLEGKRFRFEG
ncbi:ARM repeat-containing protein [Mytilinidion resinicola]|uniref:ARM repeat-containing protein n=1 Tax=Mytilinidion resinicola TaxID=574789 RepID=A0A6A6YA98_9PEZI|nr:ARM repeat-containing protein [Mytilinidion resinicola]KAF2805488.1 ARM repeat-containing protein [Mytilinidion resinicola]